MNERQTFGHGYGHFNTLGLGLGLHGDHGLLGDLDHIQGNHCQVNATSFNARDVKDVVNETAEAFGVALDDTQVLTLFLVPRPSLLVQHQLHVAYDGSQGGAQLVGDNGDEIRLEAVQLLQLVVGPSQLLGGLFDLFEEPGVGHSHANLMADGGQQVHHRGGKWVSFGGEKVHGSHQLILGEEGDADHRIRFPLLFQAPDEPGV